MICPARQCKLPPARMALKTKKNAHKAVVPAWEE